MRVAGNFHLTYCSNIHAGESWQDVRRALEATLPVVRTRLGFDGPLGVGLRLSAQAAASLGDPGMLAAFRAFLARGNYYVFTINGFPYGAFHGQRVKEAVYLPDWRDPARLEYTNRLASLMAAFLEPGSDIEGSVSTVPGAFRLAAAGADDAAAIADGILRHAAFLVALRVRTGRTVTLALEPEPACFLETTDDVIPFFAERLFDERTVASVARDTGLPLTIEDVRRHLGICLDACHMAVEFEAAAGVVARLSAAGIKICKVQLSSALRLGAGADHAALQPFADDIYLHQVVQQTPQGLVRYTDLPEALAAAAPGRSSHEWRVHFHVPIFMAEMDGFSTTQPDLAALLKVLRATGACPYLEVETYTWDVLPAQYRNVDVATAIARELDWVRATLAS